MLLTIIPYQLPSLSLSRLLTPNNFLSVANDLMCEEEEEKREDVLKPYFKDLKLPINLYQCINTECKHCCTLQRTDGNILAHQNFPGR